MLVHLKVDARFKSVSSYQQLCKQIIVPNKRQIISLRIDKKWQVKSFIKFDILNSSFNRLESIIIGRINQAQFEPFLLQLHSLPCLYALSINIDERGGVSTYLFPPVFDLPVLKYIKVSSNNNPWSFSRSIFNSKKFNAIEYMYLNITCNCNTLIDILSYTPKLRHLTCKDIRGNHPGIINKIPIFLSDLTHVTIGHCNERLETFEIFITQICFQLEVFKMTESIDRSYLNGDYWERIILKYFPHLRKFELHYHDYNYTISRLILQPYHKLLDRFISSFWIERQWLLKLKIGRFNHSVGEQFSICPYKYINKRFSPIKNRLI